jgi:hypothetical protein
MCMISALSEKLHTFVGNDIANTNVTYEEKDPSPFPDEVNVTEVIANFGSFRHVETTLQDKSFSSPLNRLRDPVINLEYLFNALAKIVGHFVCYDKSTPDWLHTNIAQRTFIQVSNGNAFNCKYMITDVNMFHDCDFFSRLCFALTIVMYVLACDYQQNFNIQNITHRKFLIHR